MIAATIKAGLNGLCFVLLALNAFGQASGGSVTDRYAEEGQRALAEGRLQDAENAYAKLRDLEPGVAEVHANLGLIYFQEGRFDHRSRGAIHR